MKGIILAGGTGSRLYPLTEIVCKQLLPVYDKPMIVYPLTTLMLLGIKDILIISTPKDTPIIKEFLGDGLQFGISLSYKIQEEPKGIAEAFLIAEDFLDNDPVSLILGDNIFSFGNQITGIKDRINSLSDNAVITGYHVRDPKDFGVITFDKNGFVETIEEKPARPKSNYAAVGLYFYPSDVVKRTKSLKPSTRGELEITDLNKAYLDEQKLECIKLRRGAAWLDAGTPQSLLDAANYIGEIENRQGLKIACLEEIALRKNFISQSQYENLISKYPDSSPYKQYLKQVLKDL
ncbi:MAG: glucose-1-phosphate thymidylyltransferase RfbA [Pseudomonadota bacterium]